MKKYSYVLIVVSFIMLVSLLFLWYENQHTTLCILLFASLMCTLIVNVIAVRQSDPQFLIKKHPVVWGTSILLAAGLFVFLLCNYIFWLSKSDRIYWNVISQKSNVLLGDDFIWLPLWIVSYLVSRNRLFLFLYSEK